MNTGGDLMIPPRLEQGGVIGICSPSHIADRAAYAGLLEAIRRMGFRTREAKISTARRTAMRLRPRSVPRISTS